MAVTIREEYAKQAYMINLQLTSSTLYADKPNHLHLVSFRQMYHFKNLMSSLSTAMVNEIIDRTVDTTNTHDAKSVYIRYVSWIMVCTMWIIDRM